MRRTTPSIEAISALDVRPYDLSREVTTDTVGYYVEELSGVYLPVDYVSAHGERSRDVARWSPEDRLKGKFGRFLIEQFESDEADEPFTVEHLVVMGTTMGVFGLDRSGYLHSLRHYDLRDRAWHILQRRDLGEAQATIKPQDYGSTQILANQSGEVNKFLVGGGSIDYGRADSAGRQTTCELFAKLLGGEIEVINSDPAPREREAIL